MPRYFLMRSAEARLVERAVNKGVWPVSHGCLERLNEAFNSGEDIVLLFTVSGSGAFQGCARMKSSASPVS
jgi:cleavage and polyadenylation specificity factor subunit 4